MTKKLDAKKLKKPFSVKAIETWSKPGNYGDGNGLYLQVARAAPGAVSKSWTFRYRDRATHKLREMGLGPLDLVTLAEARAKALEMRKGLLVGVDPSAAKAAKVAQVILEAAKAMTFDQAAKQCIDGKRPGWKSEKHAEQWTNTLATYASPVIGSLPVAAIDLPLVRKVLDPIWATKNETASRVRQRLEAVLSWATVSKYRTGENPARWKGHLDQLLSKPSKVQEVQHHPALPYAEIGAFTALLKVQKGVAAVALEFLILTATRTGEVIGATWDEIDLNKRLWTIPKERMKADKEHLIPLSPRAVEIIKDLAKAKLGGYVFPGGKLDQPLSNAAMLALLKRMGRADITSHGFRSTFRDWAGEQTSFAREVIEAAMSHQLKDKAEAAYARGTMPERRRKLMEAWAQYCGTLKTNADNVIPIMSAR